MDLNNKWVRDFGDEYDNLIHTINPNLGLSKYGTGHLLIPIYGGKFDSVYDGGGYASVIEDLLERNHRDARSIRLGNYWFPPGDDRDVETRVEQEKRLLKRIFQFLNKHHLQLDHFELPRSMEQHAPGSQKSLKTFFRETTSLATADSLGTVVFRGFSANPTETSIELTKYAKASKISKIDIDHTFPRSLLRSSFLTNANLRLIVVSAHVGAPIRPFDLEHWASCFKLVREWDGCRTQRSDNNMEPVQLCVYLGIDAWRNDAWARYVEDLNSLTEPVPELEIDSSAMSYRKEGPFADSVAHRVANLQYSPNRKVSIDGFATTPRA